MPSPSDEEHTAATKRALIALGRSPDRPKGSKPPEPRKWRCTALTKQG